MLEKLKKKPFKDRLKDTGYLLKNSFTIIGKDEDIKTPSIHMAILSIIITTIIFGAILTFFFEKIVLIGVGLLFVALFILVPFRFFYNVRQKADQSWIVYNTLSGKDISYNDAHAHTKGQKGKLRFIAFVDMVMKYLGSQRGRKGGVLGVLISLFLTALMEIWDLLSHYMLPAVVIEQKKLKEIVPEIKALKNNVPATLTGVFGIDFVGSVVSSLLVPIYILFLAISVGLGFLISLFTEITVITIGSFSFSWVPIFIIMYIIFIVGGIFKVMVDSIKVIYFTIFYTSITRPMDIQESMRDEITHYLLMKKSDFEEPKKASPQQQFNDKLTTYVKQYLGKGYTEQQLLKFLVSKGYSQTDVNNALLEAKK